MSPGEPLWWCAVIAGTGACVTAGEALLGRRDLGRGGLFDWACARTDYLTAIRRSRTSSWLASDAATSLILGARLPALLAVASGAPVAQPIGLAVLLTSVIWFHVRCPLGLDGADQMTLLVLAATSVASAVPSPRVELVATAFIGGQAVLAYATAGIAKAASTTWRSGTAMIFVLDTRSYGSQRLAGWLLDVRALPWISAWSVILFECAFPLVLLGHAPLTIGLLGVGALFHIGCAAVMGLNSFVFAFVATYPALWQCALWAAALR